MSVGFDSGYWKFWNIDEFDVTVSAPPPRAVK